MGGIAGVGSAVVAGGDAEEASAVGGTARRCGVRLDGGGEPGEEVGEAMAEVEGAAALWPE